MMRNLRVPMTPALGIDQGVTGEASHGATLKTVAATKTKNTNYR